jgi:hypothetical protein
MIEIASSCLTCCGVAQSQSSINGLMADEEVDTCLCASIIGNIPGVTRLLDATVQKT